jgi:hypothetical protein
MRKLLFVWIALALAACSLGSRSVLEKNRQIWQSANIYHYRFHLFVGCLCAFTEDMPLIVEVQAGEVVSMEYQTGNEIDASNLQTFEEYATIDRVFAEIEADLDGGADKVTVEYDPFYGFPTKVDIDFVEEAIDDEVYLTLSNFEELN